MREAPPAAGKLCCRLRGEVLRLVCVNRGYEDYAERYLSAERFVRLLLRQDTEKLRRLNAALADASHPLCVVLRNIGAILEDREPDGAALDAAEVRRANAELKAIAADVKKTIRSGVDELKGGMAEICAKVDDIGDRLSRRNCRGKRRGKYDEETVSFCRGCLSAAEGNATIRNGLNTRLTHQAVFEYNRRELEARGISDAAAFTRIIRAQQAREQRLRIKALEAARTCAPKARSVAQKARICAPETRNVAPG